MLRQIEAVGAGAAAQIERAPRWHRVGAFDRIHQFWRRDAGIPRREATAIHQRKEQPVKQHVEKSPEHLNLPFAT